MKEILNFINGEYVSTGNWFDKFTPYDGRLIAPASPRPAVQKSMLRCVRRAKPCMVHGASLR